ncbi:MAG: penicillin-binding protein 2 [Gammaproteobacteria bacterium]|jgi:cell division protein FtsI (penicillin-binding protein 3)|nr:cell division protein [Gammaproteobacteria bacterium]MDP6097312.1 penicillin-binding protein 2 [Gammaproteobacteria bacterium]|tara:strand:+ start:3138 stop:4865 length:1728 start_codon:yes stop_codon:yes gene_type:complete
MNRDEPQSFFQDWRLYLILFCMALCVGAIVWRVSTLQILERDFLQGEGDARTIRTVPIAAHRGIITDRNGEPLAVSTPVKSIWVNPQEIAGEPQSITLLAEALNLNSEVLINTIKNNSSREFLYVKRRLPPLEAELILAMDIDGVYTQQEYQRYYPQGEVTAHLVGISNVDDVGQEGLELTYDEWLRGVPGLRQVMKDPRGHIIEELNTIQTAQPGKNLELSIDFRLQNLAYRELKAEFIKRRAKSASIVVLDVDTGEVLAMANQPSYNPHNKDTMTDFSVLRNRAVTDVFEPGSTVKAFTIAAALETGLFQPDTVIDTTPGWMMIGRDEVKDIFNYGVLDVGRVITKSSNIGASKIALEIGAEPIRNMLERVGFGQPTGTGFPGERVGILRNPGRWSRIEVATLAYGYGLSTSALQLAQAYAVLADSGMKKPVSLLKLTAEELAAQTRTSVISKIINSQVVAMLETVVDSNRGGSAVEANVPFYTVAGKTGTAHVVGEFGYEENLHNSLFVGMAPASNPEVVVVVVINEPKGDEHYGGQVAAPVFSKVVAGAMRILNIAPDIVKGNDLVELTSL